MAENFLDLVEKYKKQKKNTTSFLPSVQNNSPKLSPSDIAPSLSFKTSGEDDDFLSLVDSYRERRTQSIEATRIANIRRREQEQAQKKANSSALDEESQKRYEQALKAIGSYKDDEELIKDAPAFVQRYNAVSGGTVDTSVSWADKTAAVSRLILEGGDPDYATTDRLLKQLKAEQKRVKVNTLTYDGEVAELNNYYNQLMLAKNRDILSKTKMDGKNYSVLEELQQIAQLDGDEKKKRKEAVIKKMVELGIPEEDYALYTDDKNFSWSTFGNWAGSAFKAGLNSFNEGTAHTIDAIFGNILKGVGWENNPFSLIHEFYEGMYAADKSNLNLYMEKLGGGAGWQFASDAAEVTAGALPNALLTLATMGQSTAHTTSNLVKNAVMKAGNLLTKVGLTTETMLKNPQFWTSFIQSYGNDYEEAKERGASDTVAVFCAMTTSLVNAGIEIGIDGTSGFQGLPDDLLSGNKNKAWAWIESSFEEGGEEMMQKFVSELVTKVAYDHDAEILNPTEYLREGAIGTVSGAALGGGQITLQAGANAYNQYQANKLTADEQTVLDKVVEKYVAQQEKEGKKLTASEETTFRKNAEARLRKGYIDAAEIEEILGGEDYSNYKAEKDAFLQSEDFLAYHNATQEKTKLADLEKQLEDLKNAPNTVGNSRDYDALQSKIEDIKEGRTEHELLKKMQPSRARVIALENAMRAKVRDRVKGTRLAESYMELERRNEKPNLDPEKYTNEAAKATVQNIKDSGLGNGTNEFADYVDYVANYAAKTGKVVKLMTEQQMKDAGLLATDEDGNYVGVTHGALTPDGTIVLNYNSDRNLHWTVGHEIGHVIEKTKHSKALREALFNHAIAKEGIDKFNARLKAKENDYNGRTDTTPEIELANDLLGEYVFSDYEFVSNLAKTNRNLVQKMLDEIKHLYNMAVAGSKQQRELEKAKYLFQKALEEVENGQKNTTENGGMKQSISNIVDEDGKSYGIGVHLDSTLLDDLTPEERVEMVKEYVKELGGDEFTAYDSNGKPVDITIAKSSAKFKNKNGKRVYVNKDLTNKRIDNEVKQEAIALVDELIVAAEFDTSKAPRYPHGWLDNNGQNDWEYWTTYIQDKNNTIWEATLNIANSANGEKILYDINPIKKVGRSIKLDTIPTKHSVSQSEPVVNSKFSMSKTVEETKDLVALHNLTAEKLLKSLELGGLPMPSIAITKADIPHDNFGEITLIMGKDTIDPKANKKNVVYSADAWTPTFPRVEYETDINVERQINNRLLDLASKVEDVFKHDIDMMRYSHEDNLNRYGGEEGLIQYAMEKYGLKAAYLEDQGKHIDRVTEQVLEEKKYNTANAAKYQAVADILGVTDASEVAKLNIRETIEQYGDQLEAIYPGITQTAMRTGRLLTLVQAYLADQGGEPVYRTVTDETAMRKAVDDAIDMEGFEAWTRELFSGIEKDKGIYNNKDLFTPSGNRKSFKQTHLPFTLENIVKAMASQNGGNTKNVSGFNGIKTLRAGTAERFKSIAAMHERKGRLQHLTQAEADQINDDLSSRLYNIMETIDNENGNKGSSNSLIRLDSIGETLMEISEGGKYNVSDIQGVFAKYGHAISDDLAADIKQLLYDVSQMPVHIYEAKPERAVTFDEVGVFVIPRNADIKLKQELLNRGYAIAEYDPEVEGDRNKVVNQFEEYKFSLSDASEQTPRERGAFHDRWSDFDRTDPLDDIAPVREDIAPVSESVTAQEAATELFPDDNNSIDRELVELLEQKEKLEGQMQRTLEAEDYDAFSAVSNEYNSLMSRLDELENEASDMDADRISSLEDADVPPVREMEWTDRADAVTLTKENMADIARDLRERLGLTGKQMYDVYKLVEEYAQDEYPSVSRLYETIKEKFGTYTESAKADESVRDAKKYLRTQRISVDDYIMSEIADYSDFRRRNRGKIRFSSDGLPVDVAYHELNSMYPHLFPESIIAPTDQFLQMVEVANMDSRTKTEIEIADDVLWGVAKDLAEYVGDIRYMQKEANAERLATESFDSLMQEADDIAPIADDIAPKTVEEAPAIKEVPIKAEAPKEIKTAQDKLDAKISKTQTELDNNRQLREQSATEYDKQIAEQQQKYDSLKNKNSLAANDILRRIERLKRLKATNDANYEKRISDLEARVEKMSSPEYKTAEQRRSKMEQYTEMWKNMLGDTSTWKDLAMGISYKTKTMRRFLRSVVRGADGKANIALADRIYDELETKYDHNEARLKQESVKIKEIFKKLNLNHSEDTYAHMLGELRHNPQTTLTEDVVKEFYEKHKNKINKIKVERAIAEARSTFDSLLIRVNNVLREQGMKEIPFRKGYFPHFTNPKQSWLAKLFNWKTIDSEIPTSIAGLTEQFDPQRSWQGFNKQREGDTTDYSLYQGLDSYIHGALDWIYHIGDLQKRRSLENYIRYIHSEEGIKAKIEEIKANEYYDADEAQKQIDLVLAEAANPLGNLVTELRARTNTLANKKASMDRGMEEATNRKIYSVMTNLNNRINANMVVGSFSSALTNFIPMVQSWHQVSPWFTVRGLGDMVRNAVKDDGMVAKSDFLTNRLMEEEKLYQTGWDKVADKAAFMMNVIDHITSQTVWRSKYLQNLHEGMTEAQAIKDADQFAKNLIAGRSRGNMPSIFDAKNPLIKIATAFQLEVANQYGYMFEDVPQDSKSPLRLVKGYTTAILGAYMYNALYSSLVGRDAAFDPMGIIEDLLRDLGIGDDDDDEEEVNVGDALLDLGENIVQELPFVGGLFGGGRVPLSSALPYSSDSSPIESLVNDVKKGWNEGDFTEGNWTPFVKEMLKPLYYLAMPVGGGQLKKTVEGLSMFDDDLPVSGSYTDSGNLRFPVDDTLGNKVQAAMFGQYASENARQYFDDDIAPLNEKQTQEYIDSDLPIADYWKYRNGLKDLTKQDEKVAYINSLDVTDEQKDVLKSYLFDEAGYAEENPEKYAFLEKEGIGYLGWKQLDDETQESWSWAFKNQDEYRHYKANGIMPEDYRVYRVPMLDFEDDADAAYEWSYDNPEKATIGKAFAGGVKSYRKYTNDLYNIKADKDASGKSISGSRKKKVIEYINNLDAEYGEKLILFKKEYSSDDTYNKEILEYLNGRTDLTYEDRVTILEELGATVKNGKAYWD